MQSVHPDTSSETLLATREAGRRIAGHWIWRGVSFELRAGDRLGIAGPSGSGKTLLFRTLAGLDCLDEGTILYHGSALTTWTFPDYRTRALYLMQTPALLEGTVEENLRAVFDFGVHRTQAFDPDWIRYHLAELGRDEAFLRRPVHALSGGEQQIVAFLRALQLAPEVLLLDEPTAHLDGEASRQIEHLVTAWLAEEPTHATIWTSHKADQLQRMTDHRLDLTRYHTDAS